MNDCKVLIVYERKNREFENCCLLKVVLERCGFVCDIAQFYDFRYFKFTGRSKYQFVFVPHLYNTNEVNRTLGRFGNNTTIINMQYEQVLSEKWEKLGHHTPSGSAMQAHHISWGPATTKRLVNAGISPSYVHTLGALQMDLLRKEFRMGETIKTSLADKFDLSKDKQWVLFLSSFTYANIDSDRLKMNENVAGAKLSYFVDIHTASRDKILEWFDKALKKFPEKEFIYRPHPDELSLNKVYELEARYNNFRVINHNAAKLWIEACDQILSWYSTTVVESHFLDKPYSILRPVPLPSDFDSVLLKKANFLISFESLEKVLKGNDGSYALSRDEIQEYYLDEGVPIFEKIRCLLGDISSSENHNMSSFFSLLPHRLRSFVLFLVVPLIMSESYILDKVFNRFKFLSDWKKELSAQFYSSSEFENIKGLVVRRLFGKRDS